MTNQNNNNTEAGSSSILAELLDNSARVKIIQTLIDNPELQMNQSDIARESGLTRQTVHTHIPNLVELNVVSVYETGTNKYTLNQDSEIAELLLELSSRLDDKSDSFRS